MKKITFPTLSDKIASRTFANGLRVFAMNRPQSASVRMQAWVSTGSMHEGKYLGSGLSHFLEHMAFHGTREFSGSRISEKIAGYGGELNAATSSEYTNFYFNLPPAYLEQGLTMLDSLVREPLLPEKPFQSEREVILRELAMYKDSPVHTLFETLRANTILRHPMRYPVGGFPELLSGLTPEIMREYHDLRYTPGRTFFVVVGDAEPERVFDILEKRTAHWERGQLAEPVLPSEEPCLFIRRIRTEFDTPQAYYAAAWQSPGAIHPDHIAVHAFADILGNGDSSRLYEELVKKRMLAQDLIFYAQGLSSIGYAGVAAIAEPDKTVELSARFFELLRKFAEEGPKEEELECLRSNQRTDYLRSLQTNEGIAPIIAKSVLHYGSPSAIDHFLPKLDALTGEDLIRVGRRYFSESAATVVEQYPAGILRQRKKTVKADKQPAPVLIRLKSGQKLLMLEDRALPLVNFAMTMPGGLLNEPREKSGLTRLLAETLACGCADYPETEFHRKLELNAIDLNIEAGLSALTVGVTCPAEKLTVAMELVGAMLSRPEFPARAVDRERTAMLDAMKTGLMKPETVAKDIMRKKLFRNHPFGIGRQEQMKTIAALRPADLRKFYREVCLSAPKTVFGFSGDLTRKEAEKWTAFLIRSCTWNDFVPADFPAPEFPVREVRETAVLPRQQAVIFTAMPGVRSGTADADVLSLIRADSISMASRLFQTVRNQQGLVYHAQFSFQPGFGFDGFMGYCGATSAGGCPMLEKIFRDEIVRLAKSALTRKEFENARRMVLFQLDNVRQSPEELLSALIAAEFTGKSWEYFWNSKERLLALTWPEFSRRARKLFSGKKTVTAVVLPEQLQEKCSK